MTQQRENMSAFMDGEIADKSIIDDLNSKQDLREAWKRYHLTRSIMRKELPQGESSQRKFIDISARVASVIESEPSILAPKALEARSLMTKLSAKVVPFAKQSGQFAVAASVAAAVIIGVQTYNKPNTTEPFTSLPTGAPQGGLAPVSFNQMRMLPTQNDQNVINVTEARRQVHALLDDHEKQLILKAAKTDGTEQTDGENN